MMSIALSADLLIQIAKARPRFYDVCNNLKT